tara:strand:+ start:615 stop:914 length:300 start_codon:yes stop_codon:yes gene_type:complete
MCAYLRSNWEYRGHRYPRTYGTYGTYGTYWSNRTYWSNGRNRTHGRYRTHGRNRRHWTYGSHWWSINISNTLQSDYRNQPVRELSNWSCYLYMADWSIY